MKFSQLQGAFFWNITVSGFFKRVVDVVLNRRCFGKAQSSRYLLVAPLKQVARPAGTNIHDARWPNRDDLCEARIQIHGWPQKNPPPPGWNYMWDGQEKGVGFLWGTKRLGWTTIVFGNEKKWVEFSEKSGRNTCFQSNHTYPEEKKGWPLQIDNCVFFLVPQRLEWSLHILPFSQDKQKTSKLKTQLMFPVKNLALVKFISLWDISFDFFPTISTHNYVERKWASFWL